MMIWLVAILLIVLSNIALGAATHYTTGTRTQHLPSSYRTHDGKTGGVKCLDDKRSCNDSNSEKIIQEVKVTRPCWQYGFVRNCRTYPSLNDCGKWRHCYAVADRECLTWDNYNNCVNIKKEFSCKRWEASYINKDKIRYSKEDRDGEEKLICKGMPCIDGNCVDKSFDANNEIMVSVSRLSAVSQMKGAKDLNVQLFAGYAAHCSKKAVGYSNCCSLEKLHNNWGHHLGAKCNNDEKQLIENRKKNLCVYVGKENRQTLGVNTLVKHHWCCFGNMLNKVIQVEGRKQLRMSFGSGGSPNCRGLTLNELLQLNFEKMDFREFEAELLQRMQLPSTNDITERAKAGFNNIEAPTSEIDLKSGVNSKVLNSGAD